VNNTLEFVGVLAEVFTWVGLVLGGFCLFSLLVVRAFGGRWVETDAVAVEGDRAGEMRLRWMSEGGLHERSVSQDEHDRMAGPDGVRLFYNVRDPGRARFDAVGHGEKTLRLLAWLLLGLGALALVVSIVLIFVPA
jgi:hypothetical protein